MKKPSPNDFPVVSPLELAYQAEAVLAEIDEGHPARQALWVFLTGTNARLQEILDAVQMVNASPTWDNLVDPLEAASLDLFYVLALFDAIHGDQDAAAMEAVGTLLRMAKDGVDDLTQAMIDKVHATRTGTASIAAQHVLKPADGATRKVGERKSVAA